MSTTAAYKMLNMSREYAFSLVLKPAYHVIHMWLSTVAAVVCIPFILYGLQTKGFGLLADYDNLFRILNNVPYFGKYFFSLIITVMSPYSGSINSTVEHVENGEAKVTMYDYPWLRNPFNTIHAVATTNLSEMTANLAASSAIQKMPGTRGLPLSQTTSWFKKAEGKLIASSVTSMPSGAGRHDVPVVVIIKDENYDIVCESTIVWRVQIKSNSAKSKGKR